jgi:hypothetical protein
MAKIHRTTPEELTARGMRPRRSGQTRSAERTAIIEEYKQFLSAITPGYMREVVLEDGETKPLVRMNLRAVASGFRLSSKGSRLLWYPCWL